MISSRLEELEPGGFVAILAWSLNGDLPLATDGFDVGCSR